MYGKLANSEFSILKKLLNLALKKLDNMLGGNGYHKFIYGCHTCVKIAVYVLKNEMFYTVMNTTVFNS